MARAKQAARARCLPRELVEVGPAAAGRLRLGELKGGHPEEPVGLNLPVQLLGGRVRERVAVLLPVLAGAEDGQRPRGLLLRDAASPAPHDQEQPAFIARVADDQVHAPRRAVGQCFPGRRGQHIVIDDRGEQRVVRRELSPLLLEFALPGSQRLARQD